MTDTSKATSRRLLINARPRSSQPPAYVKCVKNTYKVC